MDIKTAIKVLTQPHLYTKEQRLTAVKIGIGLLDIMAEEDLVKQTVDKIMLPIRGSNDTGGTSVLEKSVAE